MVVYKLTNKLNGKIYIGQTHRTLEQRISEHINAAARGEGFYIGHAISKYGWNNFTVETIAETDDVDVLNEMEHYYIQKYHSDVDGYNLAPGGYSNTMDSVVVKSHHDSVMRSAEVRGKISNTLKRKIKESGRTAEYANNLHKGLMEYRKTDKYIEDKKRYHLSPEHYKALNDAKNKAVYCVDESGNKIQEFPRVKDAAIWWREQGYCLKDLSDLMDRIKQSYTQDKYVRGIKWVYRV